MYLEKLTIFNYKNYESAEIELSPRLNCFVGNNGVGKTNILDAVYYLSMCKSYFNTTDNQNIRHNESFFTLTGNYLRKGEAEKIYCGNKSNQKKIFKRNDKEYKKLSEHIGLLPIVMVSPADGQLITGSSEERRKFVDTVLSQFDRQYLDYLLRYNKVLTQRNTLLKERNANRDVLEIYNDQLVHYGAVIFDKRRTFIEGIQPEFQKYYETISGGQEQVHISYQSQLAKDDFLNLLYEYHDKDQMLGYTTCGIHRDDLTLSIGNYPIRKIGSQGQQKTFLVALKFAQFAYMRQANAVSPILLLDDIFDKMDALRVAQIIGIIGHDSTFGQIFISDTNAERMAQMLAATTASYQLFDVVQHDGVAQIGS